jgi:hypothetical protein
LSLCGFANHWEGSCEHLKDTAVYWVAKFSNIDFL